MVLTKRRKKGIEVSNESLELNAFILRSIVRECGLRAILSLIEGMEQVSCFFVFSGFKEEGVLLMVALQYDLSTRKSILNSMHFFHYIFIIFNDYDL